MISYLSNFSAWLKNLSPLPFLTMFVFKFIINARVCVCVWHQFEPGQQPGCAGSLVMVSMPKGLAQTQLSKLAHNPY